MKNNLQPTKELLAKALGNLPSDNVLHEVRYHIRQALSKLEQTEKKRSSHARQKTQYQTWNEMLTNGVINPNPSIPKRTLDVLNQMIGEEKRKLGEIQARKNKSVQDIPGAADDIGDSETLFG